MIFIDMVIFSERSEDTHLEHCSHWLDYACEYEIAGLDDDIFAGICKLNSEIKFSEVSQ
jgi:hypothetical protein